MVQSYRLLHFECKLCQCTLDTVLASHVTFCTRVIHLRPISLSLIFFGTHVNVYTHLGFNGFPLPSSICCPWWWVFNGWSNSVKMRKEANFIVIFIRFLCPFKIHVLYSSVVFSALASILSDMKIGRRSLLVNKFLHTLYSHLKVHSLVQEKNQRNIYYIKSKTIIWGYALDEGLVF